MKPTIITSILLRLIAALQVWLIAVLMFGFGRVPFLVERLVYYASNRGEVSSAEKYATTYSIIVVVLVMLLIFIESLFIVLTIVLTGLLVEL